MRHVILITLAVMALTAALVAPLQRHASQRAGVAWFARATGRICTRTGTACRCG